MKGVEGEERRGRWGNKNLYSGSMFNSTSDKNENKWRLAKELYTCYKKRLQGRGPYKCRKTMDSNLRQPRPHFYCESERLECEKKTGGCLIDDLILPGENLQHIKHCNKKRQCNEF